MGYARFISVTRSCGRCLPSDQLDVPGMVQNLLLHLKKFRAQSVTWLPCLFHTLPLLLWGPLAFRT